MRLKSGLRIMFGFVFSLLFAINGFALDDFVHSSFNMSPGVTPLSHDIYALHMTIFYVCVVIGILVFSVLIYSLIRHRKSRGAVASQFHENTRVEIIWAIIPFLILVVMAIPATVVLIRANNTVDSTMTIKVVGSQWKWKYEYLDQGISFFSTLSTPDDQLFGRAKKDEWYLLEVDHPLVVPTGEKIRFLLTSSDVIHSWWVPALGIKKDAVPGFVHEVWARIDKPGIYRGQCAELCGVNHGYMPIVVEAVPPAQFAQWVTDQKKLMAAQGKSDETYSPQDLMKLGKSAYDKYCAACHKVDGEGMPPVYPALNASSVAVGNPVSRHIDIVLKGVPGTSMQAFGPQLTNTEIASIITYERNAWNNKTGQVVQPADIQKEREK